MPGFNRHRQREETPKQELKKEPVKEVKKTTPIVKIEKPKEEVKQEVKETPVITKEETPIVRTKTDLETSVQKNDIEEHPSIAVKDHKEAIEVIATHIKETVKLETIEKIPVKEKKQRIDTKEPNLIGLVGKTIVANDFRAICKKQGKQINDVLTELLHGWNMANYNL